MDRGSHILWLCFRAGASARLRCVGSLTIFLKSGQVRSGEFHALRRKYFTKPRQQIASNAFSRGSQQWQTIFIANAPLSKRAVPPSAILALIVLAMSRLRRAGVPPWFRVCCGHSIRQSAIRREPSFCEKFCWCHEHPLPRGGPVMQKSLFITEIMLAALAYSSNADAGHRHHRKACATPPVACAPVPCQVICCPTGHVTTAVVSPSHYATSAHGYQSRTGSHSGGNVTQNADGTRSVTTSHIVRREDGVLVRRTIRRTYGSRLQ